MKKLLEILIYVSMFFLTFGFLLEISLYFWAFCFLLEFIDFLILMCLYIEIPKINVDTFSYILNFISLKGELSLFWALALGSYEILTFLWRIFT